MRSCFPLHQAAVSAQLLLLLPLLSMGRRVRRRGGEGRGRAHRSRAHPLHRAESGADVGWVGTVRTASGWSGAGLLCRAESRTGQVVSVHVGPCQYCRAGARAGWRLCAVGSGMWAPGYCEGWGREEVLTSLPQIPRTAYVACGQKNCLPLIDHHLQCINLKFLKLNAWSWFNAQSKQRFGMQFSFETMIASLYSLNINKS